MKKTRKEGDRIEEQDEEHGQSLQEPLNQLGAEEDDLNRVTMKPYFPEIFLG